MQNWEWLLISGGVCGFEVYMFYDFIKNKLSRDGSEKNVLPALLILWVYIFLSNRIGMYANQVMIPLGFLALAHFLFPVVEMKRKVVSVLMYYAISAIIESIGGILMQRQTNLRIYDSLPTLALLVIEKAITFVVLKLIIRFRPQYERTDGLIFRYFMILPVTTILVNFGLLLISLDTEVASFYKFWFIVSGMGLLLSNAVIFYIYEKHLEVLAHTQQMSLDQIWTEMNFRYYKRLSEKNDLDLATLHDYKNFVKTVGILVEQRELDTLSSLIDEMSIRLVGETVKYTDNVTLNAVLCANRQTALKEGVDFRVEIQPGFDCSFITSSDIIAMLGNLIENAVEAAQICTGEKYVCCHFFYRKYQIVFQVTNTYREGTLREEKGRLLTSKTNSGSHGFGMRNIKEVVEEKYDGIFTYQTADNGIFCASAVINTPVSSKTVELQKW